METTGNQPQKKRKQVGRFLPAQYLETYAHTSSVAFQQRVTELYTILESDQKHRLGGKWAKCCHTLVRKTALGLNHPESEMVKLTQLVTCEAIHSKGDFISFLLRQRKPNVQGNVPLPSVNTIHVKQESSQEAENPQWEETIQPEPIICELPKDSEVDLLRRQVKEQAELIEEYRTEIAKLDLKVAVLDGKYITCLLTEQRIDKENKVLKKSLARNEEHLKKFEQRFAEMESAMDWIKLCDERRRFEVGTLIADAFPEGSKERELSGLDELRIKHSVSDSDRETAAEELAKLSRTWSLVPIARYQTSNQQLLNMCKAPPTK